MATALKMMTLQEAAQEAGVGVRFEYESAQYKLCKNGSIIKLGANGGFVYGVPPVDTRITTETAAAMAWERWHGQRQEAMRQALQDATGREMIDYNAADGEMVYTLARYGVMDETQRLKDRIETWEKLMQHSGADGRAPKQAANSGNVDAAPGSVLDVDALERVIAALQAAKDAL